MSLQCFYQLGVLTYFQINRDYIAEVLCINKEKPITMCNGQCFLDRTLDLAADTDADDGTPPVAKQVVDFPVFLVSDNDCPLFHQTILEPGNFRYTPGTSSAYSAAPFHPPAVA